MYSIKAVQQSDGGYLPVKVAPTSFGTLGVSETEQKSTITHAHTHTHTHMHARTHACTHTHTHTHTREGV